MTQKATKRVRVGVPPQPSVHRTCSSNQTKSVHQKRLAPHPDERSSRDLFSLVREEHVFAYFAPSPWVDRFVSFIPEEQSGGRTVDRQFDITEDIDF
jgi:hypothetical protein